jgi:hypothetical protein
LHQRKPYVARTVVARILDRPRPEGVRPLDPARDHSADAQEQIRYDSDPDARPGRDRLGLSY